MKVSKILTIAALVPTALIAQSSPDSIDQQGRTLLVLSIGLTASHQATVDAANIAASGSGQLAALAITHFVRPSVAIEIGTALLAQDDYVVAGRAHHEAVTPLLVGVSWSPRALAVSPEIRPFVSVAAGPYLRSVSDASAFSGASATIQTALGARLGTGANWFFGRHFAVQLEGDYHAAPEFDIENNARRNVSGFSLSGGLAFAWGGRAP